jgi:hypothetical protein
MVSILYATLPTLGFGALDSIFKTFLSVLKTLEKIWEPGSEDFWRCRSVGSAGGRLSGRGKAASTALWLTEQHMGHAHTLTPSPKCICLSAAAQS